MPKEQNLNIEKEIESNLNDLLAKLTVSAKMEVKTSSPDHYLVDIQTQETGLLIGFHGETINALQLLLGVILFKKLGKWIHVVLDVGGYRQMREESIKEMVNRIISEVETTGQPVALPFLTPLERRIVHMMLTDNPKLISESSGEGKDRRVMIKPRV